MLRPAVLLVAVLALGGCAAQPTDPIHVPVPADGAEVHTAVTVIDDGDGALLCPVVLESYPPQCGGDIPVEGWEWDGLPGVQQEGGVRWGVYDVTGTFDGTTLILTQPPTHADGWLEGQPSHTGSLTTAELAEVRAGVERDVIGYTGIGTADGFIHLSVDYDDGSLQAALDERYGEGAVYVTSLFRDV